jgi:hypothetical protein
MPFEIRIERFQITNIGADGKMPFLCGIWRKKEKFLYCWYKE